MDAFPLELYPTTELIQELLRRKTFLGVIVHSEEELKGEWTGQRTFTVHFNANLDSAQAGRLLDVVAGYMEQTGG
jgi:hypothetical protein